MKFGFDERTCSLRKWPNCLFKVNGGLQPEKRKAGDLPWPFSMVIGYSGQRRRRPFAS
jgi:hypothetical protein